MPKPITTLFMLMSIDWKISTWDNDNMDVDKDFPKIDWIKEWLNQYYELEKWTDLHSLNSGKVFAKVWINEKKENINKIPVSFIVIDNKPHLNEIWIDNLLQKSKHLYIVTTNKNHPAFQRQNTENLTIIYYEKEINFIELFDRFWNEFKIDRITIQSWWELNSIFLRNNLINHISLVVAPALIGWKNTPTLIDWESLHSREELFNIKTAKLNKVEVLENSYIHLIYDIV